MEDIDLISEEKAIQESDSWLNQKVFNEVDECSYQRGSFSVCIIHASANGRQFEGVGFSKARPEISIAKYDADMGKKIARGRATHDLFTELRKTKRNENK